MLALVLLAIPPILTNAYVGVREVDADVVDAARGMGMTGAEIVRRVELPLALPLVFGGIRTSAVNVIATATLGPEGGVVTLGDPIINPTAYGGSGRLGAAMLVAILAVAAEVGLGAVQRAVTPQGHPNAAAGTRGAAPRPTAAQPRGGHNRHDHPTRTIPAGIPAPPGSARAAAARRGRSCGLRQRRQQRQLVELVVARRPSRRGRAHQDQRRQRQDDARRRLEELHRAEGARRDLRPGPRRRRLQGPQGAQPRRRADGPEGAEVRDQLAATPSTPARRCCRSSASRRATCPRPTPRPTTQVKAGMAKQGITADAADAVHVVQRGRR